PDHPDVAIRLNNLASLLQTTNRLAEAEPPYRRALVITEASYGPDHPHVAIRLNNLALLLQATNRLAEAEPLYRRALAITEASYGPDHPDVAIRLNNLAFWLQATNRLAEAEPLYRRAVGILLKFTHATGHEHPRFRTFINNYARLLAAMGLGKAQIEAQLNEIVRPFGASLGGGATPGNGTGPGGSLLGALGRLARKLFGR
ncbi:MAG: tetratricopeptide repeat protein, partial [Fimbriimonadales bacterium]